MKLKNEQLSAIMDNEVVDKQLLDELLIDELQQTRFSRYQLIGDVMRGEASEQLINIDISQNVMFEIQKQAPLAIVTQIDANINKVHLQEKNNVISFVKRFGQYAMAASVAGIVVVATLVTSQPSLENNNNGLEVLNTVPFGGSAAPVSLQATKKQSQKELQEQNQRLDALLKDHQLQLQLQP